MSLLSKGIAFLERVRNVHLVEPTSLYLPGEEHVAISLPATVEGVQSVVYPNGVKQLTTYFHFIYSYQSLLDNKIPIERGLRITRDDHPGKIYEVALKGKDWFKYNDPDHKAIILYCVERNVS